MKVNRFIIGGIAASMLFASGCGLFSEKQSAVINNSTETTEEGTPTAETAETPEVTVTPEALPTEAPLTVTPIPTSTPAPRLIGTKTTQSKYIFLTNSTPQPLREVYLKNSNLEDWGKNMVPNESTVKVSETVQMFYTDEGALTYDIKVVDKAGNSYAVYGIDLSDIESASFVVEDGTAQLKYMSLSTKDETSSDYSETLAQNYDPDSNGGETSGTTADGNIDYQNAEAPTEYDPYQDYSAYEGNPNYGYYNDNGTWISYY